MNTSKKNLTKKRPLSGAALTSHLTKQIRNLEEFNTETERIEAELRRKQLARNPVFILSKCVMSGIFIGGLAGLAALFFQPTKIQIAIPLGFAVGTSNVFVKRD